MSVNDYLSIRNEIRIYAGSMNGWWKSLQSDSVAEWMLLTTLGCWGVPDGPVKLIAFILAILFFIGKLTRLQRGRSFFKTEKRIQMRIETAMLAHDEYERLFHRLNKIKKFRRNRNCVFVIKRNWRFIAGYIFLMLSALGYFASIYLNVLHH